MESLSCYALMLVVVFATAVAVNGNGYEYDEDLSLSFYHKSCPQLEKIVHHKLKLWFKNDSTLAPALINLHYRDCAVRVRISYTFSDPKIVFFCHFENLFQNILYY